MTDQTDTVAAVVASSIQYERLPDYDVFSASSWAAEDTVRRQYE